MGTLKKNFRGLNRQNVIEQIVALLQNEISSKKGLKGAVIKRAYKAVKSIKPNADAIAVNLLLDDIVDVFDMHHSGCQDNAEVEFHKYCELNNTVIAGDILEVADKKAKQMKNKKFSSAYSLIRGAAQTDIEAVVPKIGELIVENIN